MGDNGAIDRQTAITGTGAITGDTWTVPVIKDTSTTVTCLFRRWQFPSEWYTLDFDRESGKCLDERITCVVLRQQPQQAELWEGG